ncbi:SDR family NAD(P)-dependent oxidoreductase [Aurantivibrio plasticivorans]
MNYPNLFYLKDKVAIVTGAARGIGAEIGNALGQMGATVVLTDLLVEEGNAAVSALREAGIEAAFIEHDVTDESQWESILAHIIQQYGRLDIVVNNAGIEVPHLLAECDVQEFRHIMDVNVTGVMLGHKHALRVMKDGGSIINLSSVAGIVGSPGHIAYNTSKGAVRAMTKSAAIECARLKLDVRVNSVHPGMVETNMGDHFLTGMVDIGLAKNIDRVVAANKVAHPLGFGAPSDIASAVVFLASDAARWMTGAELVVDGGFTAL